MSDDLTGQGKRTNGNGTAPPPVPEQLPFPFVVGCRRSGTTLVRAILASHSEVAVAPESRFLTALVPEVSQRFDAVRMLDALYEHESFARWQLRRPLVERSFRDDPCTTYGDAVRRLYALWAQRQGKARGADKTPDHVLRIPLLAALLPEARIVHVVRDGRDVAASLLELGWVESIERAALHWRHRVLEGRLAAGSLPSVRYHELRYEDLVERPEPTVRALCAAVGLSFEPGMLTYQKAAAEALRTEPFPHHNRFVTRPLRPGLRDWRRDLPPQALYRFEALASDALAELGYEVRSHTRKPPFGTRLATRTDWLAWHRQKLTRSGRAALRGES